MASLFEGFHAQLAARGYAARSGQMIDATFVEVPRQRNTRDENALIKQGAVPIEWSADENQHKREQKDTEARWAKKNDETHYGYKNHINADQAHKRVQSYVVTDAAVHDSQGFDELLDPTPDENTRKRPVYADSAYRSQEQEARLADTGIPSQGCEKGARNHPLTEEQKPRTKPNPKCAPASNTCLPHRRTWAFGAIAQARRERCARSGMNEWESQEKSGNRTTLTSTIDQNRLSILKKCATLKKKFDAREQRWVKFDF